MKKNLYIDVGNTLIKMDCNNNEISDKISFLTNDKKIDEKIIKYIKTRKIKNIFLCSVVPEITTYIANFIEKTFNIQPIIIDYKSNKSLKFQTIRKTIGADLIALATFLDVNTDNGIMVNLGTTTTIIHVKKHKLQGVVICPGLMTSFNTLVKKAKKINNINLRKTKNVIGTNTNEAISIGVLNGHYEMINALIIKIDEKAKIFISGGYAHLILHLCKFTYIDEATIEGMKIISKQNKK